MLMKKVEAQGWHAERPLVADGGLSQEELVERVRAIVGEVAGADAAGAMPSDGFREQRWVRLPRESARAVFERCRDDAALAFETCMDATVVHFPRRPAPLGAFDVVYHLVSITKGHRLRFKVACPDPEAGVDSVTPIWKGADFLEREAFDMFGVRFNGHPDLRRILMDESFVGWPMRKEFPYRGF
jgi:NADH-quinone oxidoreductase subunit C